MVVTERGVETILTSNGAFRHLEQFLLHDVQVGRAGLTRLRRALPNVTT